MAIDVASFGDFFADKRPVEAQARTVSRIVQGSAPATSPPKEVPVNKAQPFVQVVIDDTTMSSQPIAPKSSVSKRRGETRDEPIKCLVYKDPFGLTYKKYIFTADGRYLLGGQMIGDVGDYVKLVAIVKKKVPADHISHTFGCWTFNQKFISESA
jgi:nitrite reductase (NAD(P)H)